MTCIEWDERLTLYFMKVLIDSYIIVFSHTTH